MRIVIDIPEVFIAHWKMDRFKDSLRRMKADAESCEMWSGNYEAELCDMLITAFQEAKVVPPHGRLIDADFLGKILKREVEDELNKNTSPLSWSYVYECLMNDLNIMPTIIEAEEEA